ncbi:uncharacterized protein LOC143181021 [Calliopsis andreniformis]|uniref:uncharacterized protein LOC143181021 n=1 Tax=Calliopsis andreniformis TaxID=337506 RepID=UPI003FCD4B14
MSQISMACEQAYKYPVVYHTRRYLRLFFMNNRAKVVWDVRQFLEVPPDSTEPASSSEASTSPPPPPSPPPPLLPSETEGKKAPEQEPAQKSVMKWRRRRRDSVELLLTAGAEVLTRPRRGCTAGLKSHVGLPVLKSCNCRIQAGTFNCMGLGAFHEGIGERAVSVVWKGQRAEEHLPENYN